MQYWMICIIFLTAVIDFCVISYYYGRNYFKINRYYHNLPDIPPSPYKPIKPYRQKATQFPPP